MAKTPQQLKDPNQEDLLDKVDGEGAQEQIVNEEVVQDADLLAGEQEEEVQEDASVALQKQIDALKKSEDIQKGRAERYRQEAEDARRAAEQSKLEAGQTRKDAVQSQYDLLTTALTAATNEVESAKRDMKTAIANGDPDAQTEAYDRLAVARANISRLEEGKFDLEAKLKAPVEQPRDTPKIPVRIQRWIERHPEYFSNQKKNDQLKYLHHVVLDEGHDFDSEEYLESMETHLGLRKPAAEAANDGEAQQQRQPVQQQKGSIVSAPVSREAPSTPGSERGGKITLTLAQREAAKIAGVSEKVYAENLSQINKMKANGTYGGQP